MPQWYYVYFCFWFCFASTVCAQSNKDREVSEQCRAINCFGREYECINGKCYCANGYLLNHYQNRCVRCPGLGEKCFGPCCNKYGNGSLQCWQGVCQHCYDSAGEWTCSAQVVMGAALILGVIATFALLYKLCGTPNMRRNGRTSGSDGRLSIGSLQLYIDERLRDAPPRYSRTPAAGSATYPAIAYINAGFIHDSSLPPPAYTPEVKATTDNQNTGHI